MDVPIISREAIRKNVARIAIARGGDVAEAIRIYADACNFTPESLAEIMAFTEEVQT
jgi:hypothetical protein